MELGLSEVSVGAGLLIMNASALEVPPPGAGVETVTLAVPAVAMSAALMLAVKLLPETKVVVRELPFHWTVEEEMKFEPATVNVKAEPPAVLELGLKEAAEGAGLF